MSHMPLGEVEEALKTAHPEEWSCFYPKRIITPLGYHNPKILSILSLYNTLKADKALHENGRDEGGLDPDQVISKQQSDIINAHLIEYGFPTYFLAPAFCEAVFETNPPDFPLAEIRWPLQVMVLQLPKDFCNTAFKIEICSLALLRLNHGLFMKYVVFQNDDFTTVTVGDDLKNPASHLVAASGELPNAPDAPPQLPSKIAQFVINFMAVLNARPTYLEPEEVLARRARVRANGKKSRDALWAPRFIGSDYRPCSPDRGGTHRSPRMHWRRGHFRRQKCGIHWERFKIIWFEPILINEETDSAFSFEAVSM
jgi:hypothetical protein